MTNAQPPSWAGCNPQTEAGRSLFRLLWKREDARPRLASIRGVLNRRADELFALCALLDPDTCGPVPDRQFTARESELLALCAFYVNLELAVEQSGAVLAGAERMGAAFDD